VWRLGDFAVRKQGVRVTLSVIRDTYAQGEFEECLSLCATFKAADGREAVEATLLRARCLLPLQRGAQVIEALRGLRISLDRHDDELVRRMLMAAAYLSLGQVDRALELARSAYEDRDVAQPLVQAEIAVYMAIAHYHKGEFQRAERLLEAVPANADIVYAHALLYRGYAAWRRGDYAGSVDRFRDGLRCIDGCERQDRFVEARCIHALAYLAAELPLLHLWTEVSERMRGFDWSVSGVAIWRYWIAIFGSLVTELQGDLEASTTWAVLAEEIAPDPACQIMAWVRMAARFGRNGEAGAHALFTEKARQKYEALAEDPRVSRERTLALTIADEVLHTARPLDAAPLLTYFGEAVAPTLGRHTDDERISASYVMCQGMFEERRGNRARAEEAYVQAFEAFKSAKLLRRAAIAAYRLLVLTDEPAYADFVADALGETSETYWVKAKLAKSRTEARLSPRHLRVLPLVAQGMTNEEIAAVRGGSKYTVRNMVRDMIRLLGVRNRAELVRVAAQRGMLEPTSRLHQPPLDGRTA
jgi:DNA-binding CsgD family transcriptional regulator